MDFEQAQAIFYEYIKKTRPSSIYDLPISIANKYRDACTDCGFLGIAYVGGSHANGGYINDTTSPDIRLARKVVRGKDNNSDFDICIDFSEKNIVFINCLIEKGFDVLPLGHAINNILIF